VDGVRLDLREVEDVVEQLEQVAARRADDARVLDLPRGEVAVRVVLELLGEHEQAVEGRAQLVRHVRDELRLVPGGHRQLGRLLLDEALGLLDLLVLALDLGVLAGQQRGLLGQVLVGLAQLLLAGLQLLRLRLRLLEQPVGDRGGLDRC
jgi:hypothetical protein